MSEVPPVGPLDAVTCVAGESFVVSNFHGDIRPGGNHGLYVRDTRFLNQLELLVDGERPRPLAGRAIGAAVASFYGYIPPGRDRAADPAVVIHRRRVIDGSLHEEVELDNRGREELCLTVELVCGTDFAYILEVKHGRELPACHPQPLDDGLGFVRPGGTERSEITATPSPATVGDRLRFPLVLPPRTSAQICLDVAVTDIYGTLEPGRRCDAFSAVRPPPTGQPPRRVTMLHCSDLRLPRLVRRSLTDLEALQVPDPLAPADVFCAAGSPWFLTLFGRDALWTAFMTLPYDLHLAGGTLRTLARRQGRRVDPETEEASGKILHEVRRGSLAARGELPPNYYGTVDATPLFVIVLSEAWRWGLATHEVQVLLPNLEAALGWMRDHGDPDGDGFIEYVRHGAHGLVNQGWKDSHDAVQFADGRLAQPPIALSEVQGYAYDAAMRGAELLDCFGRPGGDGWRAWAAALRDRFRERFWVEDDLGRYPAVALDHDKQPVDTPASNMGHLLSTGILSSEESQLVATRLGHPSMASGWGLRTLATTAEGYNALSYHGGSVWPHDTAIAIWGLQITGNHAVAGQLLLDLLRAAPYFAYRLPELFSGVARGPGGFPVPYPNASRPQAWAAGAGLLLLRACLGAQPSIPRGDLRLRPLWPPPFRRLELRGLPLAGGHLDVLVEQDRGADFDVRGTDLHVDLQLEE